MDASTLKKIEKIQLELCNLEIQIYQIDIADSLNQNRDVRFGSSWDVSLGEKSVVCDSICNCDSIYNFFLRNAQKYRQEIIIRRNKLEAELQYMDKTNEITKVVLRKAVFCMANDLPPINGSYIETIEYMREASESCFILFGYYLKMKTLAYHIQKLNV